MTTFAPKKCRCAVCGKEADFRVLMSTNTFGGSQDLDTRPPEMKRSTMHLWVQECPGCGYVSEEISDGTNITAEYLKSDEYKTCRGINFKSTLAQRFYKYYMINMIDENVEDAFYASLHSAWASDDEEDVENADRCRKHCLELSDEMVKQGYIDEDTISVMKSDFLRRSKQFDKVIEAYEKTAFEEEILNYIIKFEVERARAADDKCYTIEDTGFKFE